jgi:nucleoside-diphosphate-sugar epimerase/uncharacterized membrane protein
MEKREIVLITGSSGFIGSSLAESLSQTFHVIGLDHHEPQNKIPGVSYHNVDITSDENIAQALNEIKEDHGSTLHSVIHLVAYYSFSGEEDQRYQTITIDGSKSLLKHLNEYFLVEQFIFSSSLLVYRPVEIGEKITDEAPLEPAWPYPQSKVEAEKVLREEQGQIPVVNLRIAGVYDDFCHSPTISNQIVRIYEGWLTSVPFPGDPKKGQSFLHLTDLTQGLEHLIKNRENLPQFETLVLGEEQVVSYEEMQSEIGKLLYMRPWPVIKVPKFIARTGAKVLERMPFMREPFIKPWMISFADEHYDVDTSKFKRLTNWEPQQNLKSSLPKMIQNLKEGPHKWYKINKIPEPFYRSLDMIGSESEKNMWMASVLNIFLGLWIFFNPFTYTVSNGEFWSEVITGLLIAIFAAITLIPTLRWLRWVNCFLGSWLMLSPLVFPTASAAAYSNDTLLGGLIIIASAYSPSTPLESTRAGIPPGWTYNPSTAGQRIPIMFLAFLGFVFSKYLAAYQLGHIPNVWDPFFGNGTKLVLESSVSKAFPVSDAGLGALTYLLDLVAASIGGRNRWRTMPWAVVLFGLMIVPAGVTSITLIMLQPISVGAWCTVCLITAFIMLTMVPPAVDEVLASIQLLRRKYKEGFPFWRTFWLGSHEELEEEPPHIRPQGTLAHIAICSLLGIWLMFTPALFEFKGLAANNIYIIASLITTFSIIAFSEIARIVRLINVPLGLWLAASPWFMGEVPEGAQWHSLVVGLILMILSLPRGKVAQSFGPANHFAHWSPNYLRK